MKSNADESEFEKNAPDLFRKLRLRAEALKETEGVPDEVIKLVDEAESYLSEKKTKLSMEKYYEAHKRLGTRVNLLARKLLWVELSYLFFLLLIGYLTYKWPYFSLWDGLITLQLQVVWFGALGGVTVSIYGIYSHVQRRDFDPAYRLWYICKPIMGGIFGWFVFLLYYIGLISVQGIQETKVNIPALPFAIAFLAGFSERFTIRMIDKLMAVLTTWQETPSSGTPAEASNKE
jgi:hypothetical protein